MRIPLFSSHGVIVIDEGGHILSMDQQCHSCKQGECLDSYEGAVFDTAELVRTYGELSEDGYDILDVGFTNKDGVYDGPCLDWREDRDERKQE